MNVDLLQTSPYVGDVLKELKNKNCHYPEDSGVNKGVQERDVINLQIAQDIQKLFAISVPTGSGRFMYYFPKNLYLFFFLLYCLIKIYL